MRSHRHGRRSTASNPHDSPRTQPAAECLNCGCPDRTHDFDRGPLCDSCGAPWPMTFRADMSEVERAREAIAATDPTGTPPAWAVDAVQAHGGFPAAFGDILVIDASVTPGDPMHGAHRSDPHIGRYEAVVPYDCHGCGYDRAHFQYSAHHFIAGHYSVECEACGEQLESEDWS